MVWGMSIVACETQQILNDTDRLIEKTERMLDDFGKDDARWKVLGKKFGIDLYKTCHYILRLFCF